MLASYSGGSSFPATIMNSFYVATMVGTASTWALASIAHIVYPMSLDITMPHYKKTLIVAHDLHFGLSGLCAQ